MSEYYKDKNWLYNEYYIKKKSLRQIANDIGVTSKPIRVWMEKFGLKRRTKSEAQLGESNPYWKGKIARVCLHCGNKFEKYPSEIKRGDGLYCSSECWYEVNQGENHCQFDAKSRLPYGDIWGAPLKRKIRERDAYTCSVCEEYGNVVHHIDHNKMNCNESNLITMCRSCHVKHHNVNIKNINYGEMKYVFIRWKNRRKI